MDGFPGPVDQAAMIVTDGPAEVTINEDGSAEIDLSPTQQKDPPAFGDNLALHMDENDLRMISSDLLNQLDTWESERKDWEDTFKEGLKILGIKLEEVNHPFPGACAAHSPLMLEAALQFQARAITELFPAGGPVKTQIVGDLTDDKYLKAQRVREFMNWQICEEMDEYFDEHDTMLFNLPLAGSAFKKTYFDQVMGRPTSRFVPAEYMYVPYNAANLLTCSGYAEKLPMSENDFRKNVVSGNYRDTAVDVAITTTGGVDETRQEISGQSPTGEATGIDLYAFHVDYDLPGFEDDNKVALPYVITVDKTSGTIVSIRRNWREGDTYMNKLMWHTHYKFLPGLGFYGLGLVHILGNLQKTATALTRSLVDSGQFANLQAGFKAKGSKIDGGKTPLQFGEFRDVEGYGDDIRKAVIPIPTKEPSQTLFLLLGKVMDDGRRLAAVTDMAVSDVNKEAPVGTTLALMEQGIKVMSAIHKRLHRAQRAEFKILARVNGDHLPDTYPFTVEGQDKVVAAADFDSTVDVLPVSDPNIFSEAQRILRAQTQLQLAQQFPQQHDLKAALRRMHEVIGTPHIEEVLLPERGPLPMDPATEMFAVMNGQPIKAYVYQQHQAHLQAHMAQVQMLQGMAMQNPALQGAIPAMLAHVGEHQAFMIRGQVEAMIGMPLPPPPDYDKTNPGHDPGWVPLPPQVEAQIAFATGQAMQQIAQLMQQAKQAQGMQDPQIQVAMAKIQSDTQTKLAAVQQKAQQAQQDGALKLKEHSDEMALETARLAQDATLAREQMQADMQTVILNHAHGGNNDKPKSDQ